MVTVVRAEDVSPQPWGTGGGTTRELWRAPDDTWRVSLAEIPTDGPFSSFPGARRLLTVVGGTVLRLVVDGAEVVVEPGRPFAFDGDAVVSASLPEGPVQVLNVFVAGAVADDDIAPYVTVLELGRASTLPLAEDQAAFILKGRPAVGNTDVLPLSLVVGSAQVTGRCTLAVITLHRS